MDPAMMQQRMPGFPAGYPNQREFMPGNYMPGRGGQQQYPMMHPGQQPGGPGVSLPWFFNMDCLDDGRSGTYERSAHGSNGAWKSSRSTSTTKCHIYISYCNAIIF